MKKKFFSLILGMTFLLPNVLFAARDYEAKWVSQDQGKWGQIKAHVLFPGKQLILTAKFQNTGEKCWSNKIEDEGFVGFYVYKDLEYSTPPEYNDLKSKLFGSSLWSGSGWGPSYDGKTLNARAAALKESKVCKGQTGTFQFTLNAPTSTQYTNRYGDLSETKTNDEIHREDLTLAVGTEWIENYTNGDPINRAHIWIPLRFEDNVLIQEEVDLYSSLLSSIFTQLDSSINKFDDYMGNEFKHYDDKEEIRGAEKVTRDVISTLVDIRGQVLLYEPPYELSNIRDLKVEQIDLSRQVFEAIDDRIDQLNDGEITEDEFENDSSFLDDLEEQIQEKKQELKSELDYLEDEWPTIDFSKYN